jgi:putative DNA methylase
MNETRADNTEIVPFSLKDAPSLIEKAWPTSKISAETQKERKANLGQTLTALGAYWKGRKPLILTRACVLASLLPVTSDLERDIEIFEKLMGMADETFGRRFTDGASAFAKLFPDQALNVANNSGRTWVWRNDIEPSERQRRIAQAFTKMPYGQRIGKVKRPEEFNEKDLLNGIWEEVNNHLGTNAASIVELVDQLGIMRFGAKPRFADTFSGSGSIPFEAARIGCNVIASDLNPVACMLTWGTFNIVGAAPEDHARIKSDHEKVVADIDKEISALKVEHDSQGNRAKVYLYCLETMCPRTGYMIPLAPSWLISKGRNGRNVVAKLKPDHENKRYNIEILTGVSTDDVKIAEQGTVRNGRLFHEVLDDPLGISIKDIRGDYKDRDGINRNRLRQWEINDIEPSKSDIWQERLYAIQWIDRADLDAHKKQPRTWFAAPTEEDLLRENEVAAYVKQHLSLWQETGLIPNMVIEPGNKTDEPIRTRGWTHWHHLFNPRHLLILAKASEKSRNSPASFMLLASLVNRNGRTVRWGNHVEALTDTFSNQALNTMLNYGARSFENCKNIFRVTDSNSQIFSNAIVEQCSVQEFSHNIDVFLTDPPYADAVQYDEITEFFIAWLRKSPPFPFDEWIWDSRRNLAIKGEGQSFKVAMIESYRTMTQKMSDNGLQIVQFTHQDAKTWSDMAQIFWGAGLQVVQDWYVSTETMTELKKGGYVQGTHMIVLKKRHGEQSGYTDEIVHEIRDEVEYQIKDMIGLNDQMDVARGENIFNDADLQMAGYAAALRILTAYTKIDGNDMTREALRPRKKGEATIVDELTEFAVQTANEFLVPDGLNRELWMALNGAERFYLKMMDIEEAGEAKLDQFQNFAKAFRVGDYEDMMASRTPNNAKLKSATKLGKSAMAEGTSFGRDSIVRLALRAVWRVIKEDEVEDVLEELHDLIPDYMIKREALLQLTAYVATKREKTDLEEASAARILGTAIQTERI